MVEKPFVLNPKPITHVLNSSKSGKIYKSLGCKANIITFNVTLKVFPSVLFLFYVFLS